MYRVVRESEDEGGVCVGGGGGGGEGEGVDGGVWGEGGEGVCVRYGVEVVDVRS